MGIRDTSVCDRRQEWDFSALSYPSIHACLPWLGFEPVVWLAFLSFLLLFDICGRSNFWGLIEC